MTTRRRRASTNAAQERALRYRADAEDNAPFTEEQNEERMEVDAEQ